MLTYQERLEKAKSWVRKENPGLMKDEFVKVYVGNLKEELS